MGSIRRGRRPPTPVFDGAFALVSGRVAAILLRHAGLDEFRLQNVGKDSEVDLALEALRIAALRARARSEERTSVATVPTCPEKLDMSVMVTATQAAETLGYTPRSVTKACVAGTLPGHKIAGRWFIHTDDVEAFRTRG